jgi:nucleotide-binding universal stress UspA family protein
VTSSPSLTTGGITPDSLLDAPDEDERDDILRRGQQQLRALGIDADVVASSARPAAAITRAATEHNADLIVVGATGGSYPRDSGLDLRSGRAAGLLRRAGRPLSGVGCATP